MFHPVDESRFAALLLAWFDRHGRSGLPWQHDPTPYRVWVSEIMLQQTQVSTVIPYFNRFMERFAHVRALAEAPIDEVLHLWTGLGYYARARNLQASAVEILARHRGELPADLEALMALPGIGRSTAGAILALGHGQRHPILDGNVKRVLARVFGIDGDPLSAAWLKALWAKAERCTPHERVGAYTQAIMDLGATLCTRARPACAQCPFHDGCIAAQTGRQAQLPNAKKKRARPARAAVFLLAEREDGAGGRALLLERRPSRGLWGGLWVPPQFSDEDEALAWCRRELGEPTLSPSQPEPIDHAFTHFDLQLRPVHVQVRERDGASPGASRLWYSLADPQRIGLPQPIQRILARLAGPAAQIG